MGAAFCGALSLVQQFDFGNWHPMVSESMFCFTNSHPSLLSQLVIDYPLFGDHNVLSISLPLGSYNF